MIQPSALRKMHALLKRSLGSSNNSACRFKVDKINIPFPKLNYIIPQLTFASVRKRQTNELYGTLCVIKPKSKKDTLLTFLKGVSDLEASRSLQIATN